MNIRFGVELEAKVPRTGGLAVGGYHAGYPVRTGRVANGQELASPGGRRDGTFDRGAGML